ncbi:DUF6223 family protein [Salininema proteolyticum]|uniref:DUF6223 family protein n=1 Tax=Salininema proteolyticum TaxID=1607685 RepID=A0ABV8TX64_9ACTN
MDTTDIAAVLQAATDYGTGYGRAGSLVAGLIALFGFAMGGTALYRLKKGRGFAGQAAVVAVAAGLAALAFGAWNLAAAEGGLGTGNGRAGAVVAMVIGLGAAVLGWWALRRSRSATRAPE